AEQGEIHEFTVQYLKRAFFERGMVELTESPVFNDEGLTWSNPEMLTQSRRYQPNSGWNWDGNSCVEGVTWGGCYESIADMLMNGIPLPSVEEFAHIVLVLETSEEIPPADPVKRFVRALGERGILSLLQGIVVGRPKAWEFHIQNNDEQKETYKQAQAEGILSEVRKYNQEIPVVQNLDFGHTGPQIPLPLGKRMRIDSNKKSISVEF
ncbi:MAG: hypothetical protein KDD62_11645, partial [Bdellovibrionales bacterium]|nr:hypothetical protein [Bdellovibrionales bacterium]